MKLLIIGSEGFIGSNAVNYFTQLGHQVFCADIVIKEQANYIAINPEFADFARLFYNQHYDVCINASGAANVQFSFKYAALDYTLNVSNVFHLLEAIRQFNPTCRFINFSSAAVYGNPQVLPITEDAPLNPLSPYGWHKVQSEQVCLEFYTFYKIPTLSLRVFSAYGPGLKKQLFWDLYQKAQTTGSVAIYGTGNESRDFIYIDDLLNVVNLSIESAKFNGSVINVANGSELFIKDVVSVYFKMLKKDYHFTGEAKDGDPINWVANIDIIKRLGYIPKTEMIDGLRNYITWLEK